MWALLKSRIFTFKTIAGVALKLLPDGSSMLSAVVLAHKKKNISIAASFPEIPAISALTIDKQVPVALSVTGKGILYKKLANSASTDTAKIIRTIIPDANPDDFYIQFQAEGKDLNAFITRKNLIDGFLLSFKTAGYSVMSLTLGPAALAHVITFVPHPESDELSYCTALQQWLPVQISVSDPAIRSGKEEKLQEMLFAKLGTGALLFFLAILMVNFFVFNHYHEAYSRLSVSQTQMADLHAKLAGLQNKLVEKEKFITYSGWHTPSRLSFYADRIATTLPSTLLLSNLSVYPIDEKQWKEKKLVAFNSGFVAISGRCNRSIELNGWIRKLSALAFIDHVDVKNYSVDQGENAGLFELEIKLKSQQ